ncbi:hypothetical protein LTR56_010381 [Elasticomyces elasticus]|nr:hypothetical protein LTR56_010381 [Elasticomyces elasticus]KAK3656948.1 hypothetical protein LTR22_009611 [Elasticomyces elasticus]KAK4926049.1 hypothetical protein LTR49_006963 [Elasticomyces elasticus]KAK5766180.1 hypothetical protein LTS12_003664 [Elasticomyces elasticus]
MRSFIIFGAAAIVALVSADVTGELLTFTGSASEIGTVLTIGIVTVTQAIATVFTCTPESSECLAAALSNPPSTSTTPSPTLNALTVLSCAISPCPVTHSTFLTVQSPAAPTTTNALSVLSVALGTSSLVTSPTFPPALYSSFGLSVESSQATSSAGSISNIVPIPVGPATSTDNTTPASDSATESASIATTTATTSVPAPAETTPSNVESSATPTAPINSETAPVSESSSGTTVVPVPAPSGDSTTPGSEAPASSTPAGGESSTAPPAGGETTTAPPAGGETTTATPGSLTTATGTPTAPSSSRSTVNSPTGTTSAAEAATTTPAPTNAAGAKQLPFAAAIAAAAAVLLV